MSIDFDALVLAPCMAVFGEPVTYQPATGPSFPLTAVFDSAHKELDFSEGAPVSTQAPVLGVQLSQFPVGVAPLQGDGPVTCRGNAYTVADVQQDGHGGAKLVLETRGMTPYPTQIRNAAVDAIAAALALWQGDNGAWPDFACLNGTTVLLTPTWPTQSPAPGAAAGPNQLLIYTFQGRKETVSQAGTAPQFQTVTTLVIEARVEKGASDAATDLQLDILGNALEEAILQNGPFLKLLDHVRSWNVQAKYDRGAQREIGNAVIAAECVYHETFAPILGLVPFEGVNLYLDSLNIFDPSGTYTPPFGYTPTVAPRVEGPDGRVEATAEIDLPT